jgi:hypothetical protein
MEHQVDLVPTTELQAVNAMLRAIGESPVNTLESADAVDVVLAQQTLADISRSCQERGWYWNTMEDYTLIRTFPDNQIKLPSNTLKVDTTGLDADNYPVVQRGTRLFNKKTNSYAFDKNLTVDLVEFLPFEEIPQAARTFITLSAARKFQEDRVGSDTLAKMHLEDEKVAWSALVAAESEVRDATIFDSYDVARVMDR